MPRVEIVRQNIGTPSHINSGDAGNINPDYSVASALGNNADTLLNIGLNELAKQKKANDANYVANSAVQTSVEVQKLYNTMQTDGSDPSGFADRFAAQADSIYQSALAKAPSQEARNVLTNEFAGMKRNTYLGAVNYEKTAVNEKHTSDYQQSLNELANELTRNPDNFEATMNQHEQLIGALGTFLPGEQLQKMNDKGKEYLAKAFVTGEINKDPNQALDTLNGGALDNVLNAGETEALTKHAKSQLTKNEAQAKKAANQEHQKVLDQIDLGIFNGELNPEDLTQAFQSGTISTHEYINRATKMNAKIEADGKKYGDTTLVQAALENGAPLDPTNKETNKAVDTYYNDIFLDSLKDKKPEEVVPLTMEFINRVGSVPASLNSSLKSSLYNGGNDQKVQAASMINEIINNNPPLSKQFDNNELAYARKIYNSLSAGLNKEDSIKAADINIVDHNTQDFKDRMKNFNQNKKAFDASSYENGWFTIGKPDNVPSAMKQEWDDTYKTLATDLQLPLSDAKDIADKKLTSTWSVSNINGKAEYMKFAPESVYGVPGFSSDWMKEDLHNSVKEFTGQDVKNVSVTPDPRTYLSAKKGYLVSTTDEAGQITFLRDDAGKPITWVPDLNRVNKELQDSYKKAKDAQAKYDTMKIDIKKIESSPEYQQDQIMKQRLGM